MSKPGNHPHVSAADRDAACQMIVDGAELDDVADMLGVSADLVLRWLDLYAEKAPSTGGVVDMTLANGRRLVLLPTVPARRGDCFDARYAANPDQACCPFYRCKYWLGQVDSEDRPGRRHEGKTPLGTFRYEVLSGDSPSCCLDVVDAHAINAATSSEQRARLVEVMNTKAVGRTLDIHHRRVEQISKAAREALLESSLEREDVETVAKAHRLVVTQAIRNAR